MLDKPSVLASNGYFQRSPTTSSSYRSEAPHCLISENSFKVAPQFSVGILTTPSTIVVSPTQQLTKFSVNFVIAISPIDLGAP